MKATVYICSYLILIAISTATYSQIDERTELELQESSRYEQQKATENLSYVITPHRRNYLLPFSHTHSMNNGPWNEYGGFLEPDPFEEQEIKLQVSFKAPLNHGDLLRPNDGVYFGFTLKSFWQAYNDTISAPFRETNYRPEIFYETPFTIENSSATYFFRAGFEHESNGRTQLLSRSWNRAYLGLGLFKSNWGFYIQPWYRIPEDKKDYDPSSGSLPPAKGDDNPNIEDYLGKFELHAAYKRKNYQVATMFRLNPETHKGAMELSYSFPLYGRFRGLIQYFDGYGESMIDYDYRVQRISAGFLLTDIL